MAVATTKLEIVTPDRVVYEADIAMAIVRASDGELGILPHHIPLITGIVPHAMRVKFADGRDEQLIAVSGGFMEVMPDKIIMFATSAEEPVDIDVNRAQRDMERARKRLAELHASPMTAAQRASLQKEELALQRAIVRLKVAASLSHKDEK